MIHSFPKIFALGTDYINDIFKEDVEVTEKIDGSQFNFGKVNGELYMRSKGAQIFKETAPKMFKLAVDHVLGIQYNLPDNTIFYCEHLNNPKHNILKYGRVPKNNLILFGVSNISGKFDGNLEYWANFLLIESVPVLFKGMVNSVDELLSFLDKDSVLGETKIEGFVVKNYHRPFLLGGQPIPLMAGKFVSEQFKEKHKSGWGKENRSKCRWELFIEQYRTEARWLKAVQHLRENNDLENSPRDIGKLMKEINVDTISEVKDEVSRWLWKEYSGELLRKVTAGFPEWYKEYLLKNNFTK